MNISVINIENRVQLFLPNSGAGVSVSSDTENVGSSLARSALQRPEVSRAHLASMLRTALKKQKSKKEQQTYWKAFLFDYVEKNANGNDSAGSFE